MKKLSTIALFLAITAHISNLLMLSFDGVPFSIAFGIMSIGFAIASKDEGEPLPAKSKTAIIIAVVGLVFGIILYASVSFSTKILSDPESSKVLMEEMKKIIPQMPEGIQEMFKPYM